MVGNAIADCGTLLERYPSLVISQISVRPDAVRIDFRELGLGTFLSTLRALAKPRVGDDANRLLVYELEVAEGDISATSERLQLVQVERHCST